MPGRIFVTGGSGFVGSAVIDELASRGYQIDALVRRRDVDRAGGRVRSVPGDLFTPAALEEGMRGCAAVIHLVGIIFENRAEGITYQRIHFEGTRNVVDAAKRAGVRRYVHMSALGTRPDAVSTYHRTKFQAEEYVRHSGLDWTIFRPSVIHGPKGEFMKMEARWARRKAPPFLFMPYFGGKRAGRLQPVYVRDVARAFVDALEKPNTVGEVYPLGGGQIFTWPEMHRIVAQAVVGKPRMVASMPAGVAKALAAAGIGRLLGFNRDQVIMSQEDNTCDMAKFRDDFGWGTRPFDETVSEYAREL
jgi:NADH dehydrogenase